MTAMLFGDRFGCLHRQLCESLSMIIVSNRSACLESGHPRLIATPSVRLTSTSLKCSATSSRDRFAVIAGSTVRAAPAATRLIAMAAFCTS